MNTRTRVTVPIMLILVVAAGCNEAKPSESVAIDRAAATKPMLTSTAPLASPEAAQNAKVEPPILEVAEDPPVKQERSFKPVLQEMDGLTIRRLITASEVEHREPVAASSVFERHEERIYAFVEVSNESEDGKVLLVHFIGPDEQVSGGIELEIPPTVPRWRTWAHTKHAKQSGLWRVEVRNTDGTLLGALPFEVEPGL
jgi:hypothetical protein